MKISVDQCDQIIFQRVKENDSQIKLLFEMLKRRQNGISHITMPSYEAHKKFVLNHPYRIWCIVLANEMVVGNFYILKSNAVALHLDFNKMSLFPFVVEKILKNYRPLKEIKSVRADRFDFNISPKNHTQKKALEEMGAKLTQLTFSFCNNITSQS
jgi:hypothetical protein